MAYHSYTASLLTHYNYKKTNSTKAKLYKKAHSHYLPEIPEYSQKSRNTARNPGIQPAYRKKLLRDCVN